MRRRIPLGSMRGRLTAGFALFTALLLALTCSGLILYVRNAADRRADRLLGAAVHKVQHAFTDARQQSGKPPTLTSILEDERYISGENFVVMVVTRDGRIVDASDGKLPPWPLTAGRAVNGWRIASFPRGDQTVVLGLHWRRTEQEVAGQAWTLAILSTVVLACATGGAWLLVGRALSPIARLTEQAHNAPVDHPPLVLHPSSTDVEILDLASTLNDFQARLAQSAAVRGRFYAAASHELRTPLQALTGHLELALTRQRTADEYESVIRRAYRQASRLSSLVKDLLLINQLESKPAPPAEAVDLADVCRLTLAPFCPALAERKLELRMDVPRGTMVLAPPTHVEMLVRNVIENAVLYATEGGQVQVWSSQPATTLMVWNTLADCHGAGEEASLSAVDEIWQSGQLFEPFGRPDVSRNGKSGGNGLGLAICKSIADANGWEVSLVRQTDGVLCTLSFEASDRLT